MRAIALTCLLAFGLLASTVLASPDWVQFKAQHGKVYENPLEERMRQSIFIKNKQSIERFNELHSEEAGYKMGLNHLADWTQEEYNKMLGFKLHQGLQVNRTNSLEAEAFLARVLGDRSAPLPDSVDWRKVPGRVSAVKDQGQCGSCWAFSTTGVLEGQELKVTKGQSLVPLSEQQLMDCDTKDQGCGGGLPIFAMDQIRRKGGIVDEASYPYKGKQSDSCKFNKSKVVLTDSGYAIVKEGDEEALKELVAKFGPVSVGIDASHVTFQFYTHGVYKSIFCKNAQDELDHAVLVVGYGTTEKGVDYWLVKNSWGQVWGDDGYMMMARNHKNMCGIATMASVPTF